MRHTCRAHNIKTWTHNNRREENGFVETISFLGCGRDSFAFSNLRAGGDCPREGFARFPVCSHNASLCPGVLTPASLHAIAVDLEGREGRASLDEK